MMQSASSTGALKTNYPAVNNYMNSRMLKQPVGGGGSFMVSSSEENGESGASSMQASIASSLR
jgi:hypothetical protein